MTIDDRGRRPFLVALALGLVVLAVGSASDEYIKHILILTTISAMLALGFDIIFGMAGQLALSQGAFFGIGAYGTAILVTRVGLPVPVAMASIAAFNVVIAAVLASLALRVKGEYLLLLTVAFAIVTYEMILNLVAITGGPMGLSGIPSLGSFEVAGIVVDFSKKTSYLWLVIIVLSCLMWITTLVRGSYLGRTLRAVRDDDEVAAASGIRVSVALLFAFATGALYASLAGSFYAHYIRVLDPSSFTIIVSVEVLLMCVIGGRDSLWGPVIGAVLITGLPEFFRPLAAYRLVIYGLSIVVLMIFLPGGLSSLGQRLPRLGPRRKAELVSEESGP